MLGPARLPGAAKGAADAAKIPFVTTYHGIYNANSRLKRRYNAVMAKGDRVIANSNFTKNHILAEHGIDPERITVIPRGVDMALFDPVNIKGSDKTSMRKTWHIQGKRPLLLLPGRLTRWKGQLIAIEALANLKSNGIDADLVLLGDAQGRDDYVTELDEKIANLGLSDKVILADHTDNIASAYATADIVLSASTDPEAFGRVAAEAQAMEKLVVATNHGGATETVLPGKTGFLVKPGNAEALANGIASLLAIPTKERKSMGKLARERIANEFSAKSLKNATLKVYKEVLNAKSGT